jgi:hypothetical protein
MATQSLNNEGSAANGVEHGLNSMAVWRERYNIKISQVKSRAIYFSHQNRPSNSLVM